MKNKIYIDPEGREIGLNTYFDTYDTRTLSQIFPESDSMKTMYDSIFGEDTSINWDILFALLMGRYADSHIKSYSESNFKLEFLGIIFQYAPTAFKKHEIQNKLRSLSDEEVQIGSTQVYNSAQHDSSEPSDQSTWETPFINSQNVHKYKKSKLQGFSEIYVILNDQIFEIFIKRFQKLFVSFGPGIPLYYQTHVEEED